MGEKNFLNDNLIFQYQPIFDRNNNIFCYEILSRIHYNNYLYYPNSFLNILKNKKYSLLSKIVIKKNLELIKKYNFNIKLNINLNYFYLEDKKLIELIVINKNYFNIEFLENNLFDNFIDKLLFLKQAGINIFLDDFGKGKNTLNYFNDTLFYNIFDYIKLDKIFIENIFNNKNKNKKEILRLNKIIELVKLDNKKIIVEWIYNKEIYNFFKNLDVNYFQGFYLSKPLSLKELILRQEKSLTELF